MKQQLFGSIGRRSLHMIMCSLVYYTVAYFFPYLRKLCFCMQKNSYYLLYILITYPTIGCTFCSQSKQNKVFKLKDYCTTLDKGIHKVDITDDVFSSAAFSYFSLNFISCIYC